MAIDDVVEEIFQSILKTHNRERSYKSSMFWKKFGFNKRRTSERVEQVRQALRTRCLTLNLDDNQFGKEAPEVPVKLSYIENVPPPDIQTPLPPSYEAISPVNPEEYTLHPNLFEALFNFRPRKHHKPEENFLTESFAYLLRFDECVRNCWLSVLLGNKNINIATCKIVTRQSETDVENRNSIYPDMLIDGQLSDGNPFSLHFEHKWNSPCNEKQLIKYQKVVANKGSHARLVFVGASNRQKSEAVGYFPGNECACFLWEDVFNALNDIPEKSIVLKEFLGFMKSQGLGPGRPITVEMIKFPPQAFYLESLLIFAHKLNNNYSWEAIPKRFHAYNYVHKAYGRVGIRFETKKWKPSITVGFLYDVKDHKVSLVSPDKGIDLLLRIEAYPKDTNDTQIFQHVLNVLNEKRNDLLRLPAKSVLLKGERGNGNPWSVLIVQDCLADVIDKAKGEPEQLTAIHKKLTTWLEILFKDGKLEDGLKASGLDSGMKLR